jgi:thioredoxin-like negative regulator of GroEL
MNQAMKPVWLIFAVLVAVAGVSLLVRASRPDEIVPWRAGYSAALEEARASNKPPLVYFTASWCGPCQSLKHTTWADKAVEAALRDYVPVKVDIDEHPDLAQSFKIDGVPTFVVLDRDGHSIKRVVGALPPREFLEWLKP